MLVKKKIGILYINIQITDASRLVDTFFYMYYVISGFLLKNKEWWLNLYILNSAIIVFFKYTT